MIEGIDKVVWYSKSITLESAFDAFRMCINQIESSTLVSKYKLHLKHEELDAFEAILKRKIAANELDLIDSKMTRVVRLVQKTGQVLPWELEWRLLQLPLRVLLSVMFGRFYLARKRRRFPNIISLFQYILPRADREEFIADLIEIKNHLKECESGKWTIFLTYFHHLRSVLYFGLIIRLKSFFYTAKKKIDN